MSLRAGLMRSVRAAPARPAARPAADRRSAHAAVNPAWTQLSLTPSAPSPAPPGGARAVAAVGGVLASPGRPLDAGVRSWIEPRMGRSFDGVRLHTGARAEASARAVDALAYTAGENVVFGAGQYRPETAAGRRLIAHELAHVTQQAGGGAGGGRPAGASIISRQKPGGGTSRAKGSAAAATSSTVKCPAGKHGAPANADSLIQAAQSLALAGTTVALGALTTIRLGAIYPGFGAGGGYTMPTGSEVTWYGDRFGLPSASGKKFKDRIGGKKYGTQAEALYHETAGLQKRYGRIDHFFGGSFRYVCITTSGAIGKCTGHCKKRDATACPGGIMLCPGFWKLSTPNMALLLIHEVTHLVLGMTGHHKGLTHPTCYACFVADAKSSPCPIGPACVV